jgi:DNA-binding response OmpR family regulator
MKNGEDTVVLVIDNDSVVRESIASYLSNNNYRVVQAASSEEGINAFHSCSPALVIYDIDIPDNSGFDTISTIFAQAPVQPIIILSDQGNTDDVIRAMRLGVSDYLLKPLDLHGKQPEQIPADCAKQSLQKKPGRNKSGA